MDPEDHQKEEQEKKKEEDKPTEEQEESSNNVRSNVDMILPPCELETMFVKGLLAPKNDLPKVPVTGLISPGEMELTELRVKIVCLDKNNQALKLELKCAEMQVEAKEKVDKQKTRLIELLDAKVASLEKKNNTLIDMVEGLIKEKETRCNRLIDATKNMETLSTRLENSQRMQRELKTSNDELKSMLNDVEEKGSKIAKLAKEKIIKYKDENTRIQGELNDMKLLHENSVDFDHNWCHLEGLGSQLQEKLSDAKNTEIPETTVQILTSAGDIYNEIRDKMAQMKVETNAAVTKFASSNEKLLSEISQLKQSISELQNLSNMTLAQNLLSDTQLTELKRAITNLCEPSTSDTI